MTKYFKEYFFGHKSVQESIIEIIQNNQKSNVIRSDILLKN